jgi:hypothetical protein
MYRSSVLLELLPLPLLLELLLELPLELEPLLLLL